MSCTSDRVAESSAHAARRFQVLDAPHNDPAVASAQFDHMAAVMTAASPAHANTHNHTSKKTRKKKRARRGDEAQTSESQSAVMATAAAWRACGWELTDEFAAAQLTSDLSGARVRCMVPETMTTRVGVD